MKLCAGDLAAIFVLKCLLLIPFVISTQSLKLVLVPRQLFSSSSLLLSLPFLMLLECEEDREASAVKQWLSKRFHVSSDSTSLHFIGSEGDVVSSSALTLLSSSHIELTHLDLSFGRPPHDLRRLERLIHLQQLVLDNCQLGDDLVCPSINTLTILSLNKNYLRDLVSLLKNLNFRVPQLQHLSLLGNPLCPHPGSFGVESLNHQGASKLPSTSNVDNDEKNYSNYRLQVIRLLPSLLFLDARPITSEESSRSLKFGFPINFRVAEVVPQNYKQITTKIGNGVHRLRQRLNRATTNSQTTANTEVLTTYMHYRVL